MPDIGEAKLRFPFDEDPGKQWEASSSGTHTSRATQGVQFGDEAEAKLELSGVYARYVKGEAGSISTYKYEPIFKPPREKDPSGNTLTFNRLSLGGYNTPVEAEIVGQIAAFYYGRDEGRVALGDGSFFSIPLKSDQEKCLIGLDKAQWVSRKAKEVFTDFQKKKAEVKLGMELARRREVCSQHSYASIL